MSSTTSLYSLTQYPNGKPKHISNVKKVLKFDYFFTYCSSSTLPASVKIPTWLPLLQLCFFLSFLSITRFCSPHDQPSDYFSSTAFPCSWLPNFKKCDQPIRIPSLITYIAQYFIYTIFVIYPCPNLHYSYLYIPFLPHIRPLHWFLTAYTTHSFFSAYNAQDTLLWPCIEDISKFHVHSQRIWLMIQHLQNFIYVPIIRTQPWSHCPFHNLHSSSLYI